MAATHRGSRRAGSKHRGTRSKNEAATAAGCGRLYSAASRLREKKPPKAEEGIATKMHKETQKESQERSPIQPFLPCSSFCVSLCIFVAILCSSLFPDGGFVLEFCDQIVELVAGGIAVGAQLFFFLRDF